MYNIIIECITLQSQEFFYFFISFHIFSYCFNSTNYK
nr:MAG TPA: hypothetical protein [Caudoviricetes sp.]